MEAVKLRDRIVEQLLYQCGTVRAIGLSMASMHSWRWWNLSVAIVLIGVCPVTSADAGQSDSSLPNSSKGPVPAGFTFLVDANNCLTPEEGFFEPDGFSDFEIAERDVLLPDTGAETILHVVVQPSFEAPSSIRLERERGVEKPTKLNLRLVRARKNLWTEMMREMRKEQGNPISLAKKYQKRALAKVTRAVDTKILPITQELSDRLTMAWASILARTQYVNEVLVAPDGSSIGYYKTDGTDYHFWHDRRAGTTHSPDEGSLLADFVKVVEQLLRYVDSSAEGRPREEKTLQDQLGQLQTRIAKQEPCLRPEAPVEAKHAP
jgi:hypothetical protein